MFVDMPWLTSIVSVLWIVALVNSFNMLDNMDGLSAGVAAIASAILAAVLLTTSDPESRGPQLFVAGFLLVLVGSLVGFLWHNRPPARLFMGDAGSYFIGFYLAVATIMATFSGGELPRHSILTPLCVMAVPLYDMTSVIFIRLRQGRSPFEADKNHFSHRLVELGMTKVAGRADDLFDDRHLRAGRTVAAPGRRGGRRDRGAGRGLRVDAGGRVGNDRSRRTKSTSEAVAMSPTKQAATAEDVGRDIFRPWLLASTVALFVARPLLPSEGAIVSGDALLFVLLPLVLAAVWALRAVMRRGTLAQYGAVDLVVLFLVVWHAASAIAAVRTGAPRPAINSAWNWVALATMFFLVRQLVDGQREAARSRQS